MPRLMRDVNKMNGWTRTTIESPPPFTYGNRPPADPWFSFDDYVCDSLPIYDGSSDVEGRGEEWLKVHLQGSELAEQPEPLPLGCWLLLRHTIVDDTSPKQRRI